jgi:hypothetical protein
MTLRDHRNKAKQWSYGRAQLSERAAAAPYGKRRTKLTAQRVKAGEREQQAKQQGPGPEPAEPATLADDKESL